MTKMLKSNANWVFVFIATVLVVALFGYLVAMNKGDRRTPAIEAITP